MLCFRQLFSSPPLLYFCVALTRPKSHTSINCNVEIEAVYEIDNEGNRIRALPPKDDCDKIYKKKERKKGEEQEEKAAYKAFFSDGQCSGPYIAKVSENDIIAIELADYKLTAILSLEKHDNITAWERESLASCWAAWRQ